MASQGRGFLCLPRRTEELAVDPGKDWMCCKTGLRGSPPDSLVVCLIMAGQEALREGDSYPLRFHSDGTLDDMEQGLELWEDCTGPHRPGSPSSRAEERARNAGRTWKGAPKRRNCCGALS